MSGTPTAINAAEVAAWTRQSGYPAELRAKVEGRSKRRLGEVFGLRNFGVNLTTLAPGAASALRHAHRTQDEFVFILEGEPVLLTDAGETPLKPGMCAGFRAGSGDAHCLVNRTERQVHYMEIGDRAPGEVVTYPDDDLLVTQQPDGSYLYTRKDGTPV